jgi:hypothetical protein
MQINHRKNRKVYEITNELDINSNIIDSHELEVCRGDFSEIKEGKDICKLIYIYISKYV